MSTLMTLVRRKTKIRKTKYRSHSTLSKPALIAIVVVIVIVVLIALIVLFIIMRRRKKASAVANKHSSTMPGYSTDSSGGLYNATPGYFAGHGAGAGAGGQQQHPAGDYGGTSSSGYHGGDGGAGGQGAAAEYFAASQHGQGGGGWQGQDYGRGSYDRPQRPPMAYNSSPAHV